MAHQTIKDAITTEAAAKLQRARSSDALPPPNYDIAIVLYERNPDGSVVDEGQGVVSFSRPQDFATDEHMQYCWFGVMRQHEQDGQRYTTCWLVHLYWNGDRDEESARALILNNRPYAYGQWEPTAPSDPLLMDDFWDHDALGDPPNAYWEDVYDRDPDATDGFTPFDNFARPPYKQLQFGGRDE